MKLPTIAELEQIPHEDFEINGQQFMAHRGEDVPELLAILLKACELKNNADPNLVRINHNTWVKR